MSDFEKAVPVLLAHEGSAFVVEDNGRGASKYGVTLATYRELFPEATTKDIAMLTPEIAASFYKVFFWDRCNLGMIDDQTLATKVLELAVNTGPVTAIRILQRAAGATVDGILGPKTAAAVNRLPALEVMSSVRELAAAYYRRLAENPKLAGNLNGWLKRLNS